MAKTAKTDDKAMYLVDERFMVKDAPDGYVHPSGWDTDNRGGGVFQGMRLEDKNTDAPVIVSKKFIPVKSGVVTAEFIIVFMPSANTDGVAFSLTGGGFPAVMITSKDNAFFMASGGQTRPLGRHPAPGEWHSFKIVADLDAQKADIYISGVRAAEGAAFANPVSKIDGVSIQTGKTSLCTLYIKGVRIYVNYCLNERFASIPANSPLPTNWQSSGAAGGASIQKMASDDERDTSSIRLENAGAAGVYAAAEFAPKPGGDYVWDFKFLIPKKIDGASCAMTCPRGGGLTFITRGEDICYVGEGESPLPIAKNYIANLWYNIRAIIRPYERTADIYVNGKLRAKGALVPSLSADLNKVIFEIPKGIAGTMWVDDVLVCPFTPEPADYVPVPAPVEKSPDMPKLGFQTCSLWREGNQWGWDLIAPYRERKPLLGFYDEGNPETADWEIKWMLEHGVDFMSFCWFRYAQNEPIKRGIHDPHLIDGFMYAKYSDMFKFMIMWENVNDAGIANADDLRENVVPFWIEYMFKDHRYLKIDNRPVIGIFHYDNLKIQLGETTIREGLDIIRDACVAAGFAGAYIILATASLSESISEHKTKDGFDAIFCYSWNDFSGVKALQQSSLLAQQKYVDTVPTLTFGRDNRAWFSETGQIASPDEFKSSAEWIWNVFLQSNIKTIPNSIASKMMLIGNWNEFGEGHYGMPAELAGFGYLDGLRSLYTNAPHTDCVPSEAQRARINELYPVGRALPYRPLIAPPPMPFVITARWDFGGGVKGWSAPESAVGAASGCLEVSGGGTTRRIVSPNDLFISADKATVIKMRVKNENKEIGGYLYFSTFTSQTMDEEKKINLRFSAQDKGFTEYFFDAGQNEHWRGTLKQLRFDLPGGPEKIFIEYIHLLEDTLVRAGENLISDWSFEAGALPDGAESAEMEISSSDFAPGSFKSLKVKKTAELGMVYFNLPGVSVGRPFYYSAEAKLPFAAAPGADCALTMALSYNVGGKVKTVHLAASDPLSTDNWRKVSCEHTISEPCEVSDVRLQLLTDLPAPAETYFLTFVQARPIVCDAVTTPADGESAAPPDTEISISLPPAFKFGAPEEGSITVGGAPAGGEALGAKLLITPAAPLKKGGEYKVIAKNLKTSAGIDLPDIVFGFTT